MADTTTIEWTDASLNPIRARNRQTGRVGWHCEHASDGCRFCYAEGFNRRLGTKLPYRPDAPADVFLDEAVLARLAKWRRPRLVFMGSMTDLFARFVTDEMLDRIFAAMEAAPWHIYQLLTKRPARMAAYLYKRVGRGCGPLSNVWLGTSAEDQRQFALRGRPMAAIAEMGWHTWCSAEPLLGPISIAGVTWLRWLVVGGESGTRARIMLPRWLEQLRQQCAGLGIPFFFKQWGAWAPREPQDAVQGDLVGYISLAKCEAGDMQRIGKARAGAMLHGRHWRAYPAEMVGRGVSVA